MLAYPLVFEAAVRFSRVSWVTPHFRTFLIMTPKLTHEQVKLACQCLDDSGYISNHTLRDLVHLCQLIYEVYLQETIMCQESTVQKPIRHGFMQACGLSSLPWGPAPPVPSWSRCSPCLCTSPQHWWASRDPSPGVSCSEKKPGIKHEDNARICSHVMSYKWHHMWSGKHNPDLAV